MGIGFKPLVPRSKGQKHPHLNYSRGRAQNAQLAPLHPQLLTAKQDAGESSTPLFPAGLIFGNIPYGQAIQAALDPVLALAWRFATYFRLTFLHPHPRIWVSLRGTCSFPPLYPSIVSISDFTISYLALVWDSNITSVQIFSI